MKISQRDAGFNGGIKVGSTAYDSTSRTLNTRLTDAKNILEKELDSHGYTLLRRIDRRTNPILIKGANPDGGIWLDPNGIIIAAFEAKKQGIRGNAHERWFKNHRLLSHINPDIRYVTFLSGEGAIDDSGMAGDFKTVLLMEGKEPTFGTIHPKGCSFVASKDGFSLSEVVEIMRKAVMQ